MPLGSATGGRTQTAVADALRIIVYRDAERQEDALCKRCSGRDEQTLSLAVVVGHAHEDVSFVVRTGVIAVNDADGIIELEAVFKTQAAARIDGPVGILIPSPAPSSKPTGAKKSYPAEPLVARSGRRMRS